MSKHGAQSRSILFRCSGITRNWSCQRKHAFSRDRAIRTAKRRAAETGERLHAYPCLFCPHWHIGHVSRRLRA